MVSEMTISILRLWSQVAEIMEVVRKIVIQNDSTLMIRLLLPEPKRQYEHHRYTRCHEFSKLMQNEVHNIANDLFEPKFLKFNPLSLLI